MDTTMYAADAEHEETHWWFVGRRRLFARTIREMGIPPEARVLDVGTSSGTNLRMLRDSGIRDVTGLDMSPEAARYCAEKGLGPVEVGDVTKMPFPDRSFDLVLATDIIEHVEDDLAALREVERVLKPGGRVLLTVPAFQTLWGFQDEISHHKRRYRREPLLERVRQAGLLPGQDFHFNYLLFLPIWLWRQATRFYKPKIHSEAEINTAFANRVLSGLFDLDIMTAPRVRPPFGVSLLVTARKPAA